MRITTVTKTIRVLVAGNHDATRIGLIMGLTFDLNIDVVDQAFDGRETVDKAVELEPDIVIMDIFVPGCGGPAATSALACRLPRTRVLILAASDREEDLLQAVRFGARGCLWQSAPVGEIVAAVRQVAAGEAVFSPYMAGRLFAELCRRQPRIAPLSHREMEVLRLVGEGLTSRGVSRRLAIAEDTVRSHLRRVLDKLHLEHRGQAVAYAVSQGLLEK